MEGEAEDQLGLLHAHMPSQACALEMESQEPTREISCSLTWLPSGFHIRRPERSVQPANGLMFSKRDTITLGARGSEEQRQTAPSFLHKGRFWVVVAA